MEQVETAVDKEREAKRQFIKAYFDGLGIKINYLDELFQNKHREEALLLCCCYIEGVGNSLYWPTESCWKNFVRILINHGGNEIFGYIHPIQLQRAFASTNSPKSIRKIGEKIYSYLICAERKLYSHEELIELIKPALNMDDLKKIQEGMWKGTFAAIAYEYQRNLLVHSLGAADVSFGCTTFQGQTVPNIDFSLLYSPLKQIFRVAERISLESVSWFGHDFKNQNEFS